MHSTIEALGERALIKRITARFSAPSWVVVPPGDDAAVLEPERGALEVLTTDALVEGVHFDSRFVPPDAIGHRALAVNLSDIAAMGGTPRAALLSLVLPPALEVTTLDGIIDGVVALAATEHVAVVGGNITRSPGPLMIDVTVTGGVRRRQILTRSGARPGDEVFVTGRIGDAAAGLGRLQARSRNEGAPSDRDPAVPAELAARFLRPVPRMRVGRLLGRARAASACMDLSDGLADGVHQICEASGVGMQLDARALPVSDAARAWFVSQGLDPLMAAVVGGDDYELLFTVRPRFRGRFRAVQNSIGNLPITRIGVVTRERRLVLCDANGEREVPSGYEHFR